MSILDLPEENPFAVLMISRDIVVALKDKPAQLQKIAEVCAKQLAMIYHPDLHRGDKRFEQLFAKINTANDQIHDRSNFRRLVSDYLVKSMPEELPAVTRLKGQVTELESNLIILEREAKNREFERAALKREFEKIYPNLSNLLVNAMLEDSKADSMVTPYINLFHHVLIVTKIGIRNKVFLLRESHWLYTSEELNSLVMDDRKSTKDKFTDFLQSRREGSITGAKKSLESLISQQALIIMVKNALAQHTDIAKLSGDKFQIRSREILSHLCLTDEHKLLLDRILAHTTNFTDLEQRLLKAIKSYNTNIKRARTVLNKIVAKQPTQHEIEDVIARLNINEDRVGLLIGSIEPGDVPGEETVMGSYDINVKLSNLSLIPSVLKIAPIIKIGRELIARFGEYIFNNETRLMNLGKIVEIIHLKDLFNSLG